MHARGDVVRASVILAQGLKRAPGDIEAVEWLLHMYVEELPNPGIEPDLLVVLSKQPNGADLLALVQAELSNLGATDKLRALDKVLDITPIRFASESPVPERIPTYEDADAPAGSEYDPRYAHGEPAHHADAHGYQVEAHAYEGEPHPDAYAEAEPRRVSHAPEVRPAAENWDAFDSPFESDARSNEPVEEEPDVPPEVLDSSVLGTLDTLPEHLRAEYAPELGAVEPPDTRPIWFVAIAAVAIVVLLGLYSMARMNNDEVVAPNWEQEGSSE